MGKTQRKRKKNKVPGIWYDEWGNYVTTIWEEVGDRDFSDAIVEEESLYVTHLAQ